jgi:hypothetical protein
MIFKKESRGYHHDQSDLTLYALDDDGKILGYIEYSVYKGDVAIQWVKSNVSRQKIATKLMIELQKRYPGVEIDHGYTTEDGDAFNKSLPKYYVPNKEYKIKKEEIEKLEIEYNILNNKLQNWYKLFDINKDKAESQRNIMRAVGEKMDKIDRLLYDLKIEIEDIKPGNWLIKTD